MIKTLSVYDFIQEFKNYGRDNHFSVEGLEALYEWLEEVDPDFELDVIGLCCDFTEYESLEEFNKDYGQDFEDLEEVRDHTVVIELLNGAFIIQAF